MYYFNFVLSNVMMMTHPPYSVDGTVLCCICDQGNLRAFFRAALILNGVVVLHVSWVGNV